MRNYLVTLTKGGRSFFVKASSSQAAEKIVLAAPPCCGEPAAESRADECQITDAINCIFFLLL